MPAYLLTIIAGRVLLIAYSVISLRLATEILGTAQIGVMHVVLSAVAMVALLIGSISLYFNRQFIEWHLEGRLLANIRRYTVFLIIAACVACTLFSVVYAVLGDKWTQVKLSWLLVILVGNLLITSLNGNLLSGLNSLGYRSRYVLLSNLAGWGGLAFALAGAILFERRAEYWLCGLLIGQVASLALALCSIRRAKAVPIWAALNLVKSPDFRFWPVFRFSWPLTVCTGLYWIQRESFRPIMASVWDIETVGLFSVGFSVGMLVLASFETLFREYYAPIYYRAIAHSTYEQKLVAWNRYADAYFPAVVLVFLFVGSGGEFFLRLLASEEFQDVGSVVIWGALSQAVIMFYAAYVNLTTGLTDNLSLIAPSFIGAVVVIVLLLSLTGSGPFLGTGLAVVLGLTTSAGATAFQMSRKHQVRIPWARMLQATFWGAPLVAGLQFAQMNWPVPSQQLALWMLFIGGLYLIFAQYRLARHWLNAESEGVGSSVS